MIKKEGRFRYKGTHEHAENNTMLYKPSADRVPKKEYRGSDLFITQGKYQIDGNVDAIDYVIIKGGLYDDPLLQKSRRLFDSLTYARELLF